MAFYAFAPKMKSYTPTNRSCECTLWSCGLWRDLLCEFFLKSSCFIDFSWDSWMMYRTSWIKITVLILLLIRFLLKVQLMKFHLTIQMFKLLLLKLSSIILVLSLKYYRFSVMKSKNEDFIAIFYWAICHHQCRRLADWLMNSVQTF